MSNFNFTSQVCTTKEQSERLIKLGLKKETADMAHIAFGCRSMMIRPYGWLSTTEVDLENFCPAWSLHRLIEMMPYDFTYNNDTYELQITDNGAGYDDKEDRYPIVGWWRGNTYDDIIDCIEWLIKEGYFNKEYLERI